MTKIIAIGNAIVDILCKVDEEFLLEHNLIKGSMSLIGDEMAEKLSLLKAEKITSGGSAANSIAALAQMGASTAFIGKIGHDKFASQFVSEIEKSSAQFIGATSYDKPSAKSFILVTPDAQRTMCTFLGCAGEITEEMIKEESFKNCKLLYLEGYLWDEGKVALALKKAIDLAKKNGAKIAFSLSDQFCVARHKKDFIELLTEKVDIVFANESEALELSLAKDFSDQKVSDFFFNKKHLTAIITRSEKSCVIFKEGKINEIAASKIDKILDTTGAGDAFAAGFIKGLSDNKSLHDCAKLGHKIAAKIITKFGARFENEEIKSLL